MSAATSIAIADEALRAMPMRIVAPDSFAQWDRFVASQSQASFCHLSGWRHVIEDVMGHRCLYRCAVDAAGRIVGVLPLARIDSPFFGQHLVSLPFLNYGGPVGSAEACRELANMALREAHGTGAKSLVLRSREAVSSDVPPSQKKITVLLELASTPAEMWDQRFNAKFRNKIKRPQREGMDVRFGLSHVDAFYEVFAHNMRDLGTPVLPRAFFERVAETFPELCVVGAVYWKERPVAAGWGFVWRDEFEMTWSSSLRELGALKPNMLLYWAFMERLIEQGVARFNFGRSTPGSGPHEFKNSWGGVDVPLAWSEWPAATEHGDSREGRAMRAAVAAWRRLPLGVTKVVGPTLARALPWW